MAQMGFGRLVVNSLFTSVIIVLFITSGLIVNALWTIILPLWFAGRRDLYRACCKHITTAWFRSKFFGPTIGRSGDPLLKVLFSNYFHSFGLGKMQIQNLFRWCNRKTCWKRSWNCNRKSSLYQRLDYWFYCCWTI